MNVDKKVVNEICRELNINPKEIDYISYKEATNYNYYNLKNSIKYSDIIIGPTPHKGGGMGNSSSIITLLEGNEYPNTIRACSSNELKITKQSLFKSLIKTNKYLLGGAL